MAFVHRDKLFTFECNAVDMEKEVASDDVGYDYLNRMFCLAFVRLKTSDFIVIFCCRLDEHRH
jgi:hypothetical protein